MQRLLRLETLCSFGLRLKLCAGYRAVFAGALFAAGFLVDVGGVSNLADGWVGQAQARRASRWERFERFERFDRSDNNNGGNGNNNSNNNSNDSGSGNNSGSNPGSSSNSDNSKSNGNSTSGSRAGPGTSDNNSGGDSSQPPRTLQEFFSQDSKPAAPAHSPPRATHGHRRNKKDGNNKSDDDGPDPPGESPAALSPGAPQGPPSAAKVRSPTGGLINHWTGNFHGRPYAAGEVLGVKLSAKGIQKAQTLGFGVTQAGNTGLSRLHVPEGMDARAAETLLKQNIPNEKFALNQLYRVFKPSGDREVYRAHGVVTAGAIGQCTGDRCAGRALLQWDDRELSTCVENVKVGVIDTDIDHAHPALKSAKIGVFLPNGRDPAPNWHGTGVFAVLAGNSRSGTPGLIPRADFHVANIFFKDDRGEFAADTVVLKQALQWMEVQDVKVVNMSFAGPRDDIIEPEIARLSAKGMIFIAAVGNEGPGAEPSFPAAYKSVIAVTAVNKERKIYTFASRGRHIDLAAPGVDIWTAVPGGREGYYSGTSFAAPYVTALVAALQGKIKASRKENYLDRLEYLDLGLPGRDSTYGRGLPIAPSSCAPPAAVASEPRAAPPPFTTSVFGPPTGAVTGSTTGSMWETSTTFAPTRARASRPSSGQ